MSKSSTPRQKPQSGALTSILVVDDEPIILSLLSEVLHLDGYEVDTAPNGLAALDKLRERAYGLVLCDLKMPKLDGEGFYRQAVQLSPILRHRFVFVTGSALDPHTLAFLNQTGARVLSKPFSVEELRRVVRQALLAVQEAHPA